MEDIIKLMSNFETSEATRKFGMSTTFITENYDTPVGVLYENFNKALETSFSV